ncbi:MAG: gamma-glutamylcyclotransferase [Kiloniellaceae bacterium]
MSAFIAASPANAAPVLPAPLKREDFTEERIQRFARLAAQAGFRVTTEAERDASLAKALARRPDSGDLWVFGYGSLMWNPALLVEESRPAKIFGYRRRFCLDQCYGRGSPEVRGAMLGLDRGGATRGVAHRIAAENIASETKILWRREMPSGAYIPTWSRAALDGGRVWVLTFVNDTAHGRYIGALDEDAIVARIALAEGQSGTNRAYLYDTVDCLQALGIADKGLIHLARRVRAYRAARNLAP